MSHVRQQIREAFGTACTSLATTGSNVFQSRVYPMEASGVPGLCIYTMTESVSDVSQEIGGASRLISRSLTVRVEGYAQESANLDDKLDTISAEVETAVANSSDINALITDLSLASTEIAYTGEADQLIGVVTMEFAVLYTTAFNDPETAKG